ncbi:prephenate dehydrogenase/arogenate dehydrogenase family protein [Halorussus amylolyticus]|uniref:prephenate dehydrogenase/arogenate dehydrogenase family protein n=1 Tax=Halorussus amylolyticus TaxID=1126242 RepID=UPI0010500F66|nr:prephenate dehydrogenase/arogenate dehydrogenase family protein [Halorussus amylolyticus]
MKLLVVGAGEMGRWVGRSVDAEVAFADADPAVARAAASDADARTVSLSTDERFDAVCIAVPISAAESAIADHAPKAESAILDVTGAMAGPVAAMAERAPDRERVSLHPLFAAANSPGNIAVVSDAPGPTTDRILDDLREQGNDLVETTPEEHDAAMETVQSGAHAAILAFALAADEIPDGLTTPVFEDLRELVEQVTGNTPGVYAEIRETFDGAEAVADAATRLAESDPEAFEDLYREAGEAFSEANVNPEDDA